MKILFVTTELDPFAKVGGLADVSAALPKELYKRNHDLRIIIPKYATINSTKYRLKSTNLKIKIPDFKFEAMIKETNYPSSNLIVYFVDCDYYFNREEIYGDYKDNAERFIYFSRVIVEFLRFSSWKPDIIHCNDWQTGLIPALLKNLYHNDPIYEKIRTLFTIHNLAYQGIFPKEAFEKTGLNEVLFEQGKVKLWGKLNLLKAGLVYADILNTVSEKYALEIQTPELGYGLGSILSERKDDLYGILNGIDYEIWDPSIDTYIWHNYDRDSLEKKELNKLALQKECQLPQLNVPIIGVVSRLVNQKGFDLVAEIFEDLMDLELQFILVGSGQPEYQDVFKELGEKYRSKSAIYIKFDNVLAHKIEAGADYFLMPSRYEPCGLNQLISLRYGTIPIVYHTGGLADSISDIEQAPTQGLGFVFYDYSSQELLNTINKAMKLYKNKEVRMEITKRGMQKDFSWQISAQKYELLYQKLLQKE